MCIYCSFQLKNTSDNVIRMPCTSFIPFIFSWENSVTPSSSVSPDAPWLTEQVCPEAWLPNTRACLCAMRARHQLNDAELPNVMLLIFLFLCTFHFLHFLLFNTFFFSGIITELWGRITLLIFPLFLRSFTFCTSINLSATTPVKLPQTIYVV